MAQPNFSPSEKLLPYQGDEKAVFAVDHTKTTAPVSKREKRKCPSFFKTLTLIIAATLILSYSRSSGRPILQFAGHKEPTFSAPNQAESHIDCPHKEILEPLSYITATPQNARKLNHAGWETSCSTFDGPDRDCRYAIENTADQNFWQSKEVPAGTAHWFAIDLKQKQLVHSVEVTAPRVRSWRKGYIQNHKLEVAAEPNQWETVAIGAWRAWKDSELSKAVPRRA